MKTFAGIESEYSDYELSEVLLQSIPYDGTSTWGKGADRGFEAFIEASENMELYDIETNTEVYKRGICIIDFILESNSSDLVFKSVYANTKKLLAKNKFLTFFGGEHSISIGIIKAFYEKYNNLTVLHLDAHADLRESYEGNKYSHACAVHDASKHTNLIQVGIRSMASSENEFIDKEKCFFAEDIFDTYSWIEDSISKMTKDVYITLDLDVFDPSIMPSTGTPEPGGLGWNIVIKYLKKVFKYRNIVGFDIVELAPIDGYKAPNFLAAKLYYKMLSYKFN